jgi:hypothetical protein
MNVTNGTEKQKAGGKEAKERESYGAEAIFALWMREGGLELAAERATELRGLVQEAVTTNRARVEAERAELQAKSAAMEIRFRALGFPGGPPLDEAEEGEAKKRGLVVRPTPPADDETLVKMLVARILAVQRDHPNHPAATRGLARWSGATSERIKAALKAAPEVVNTSEDRWVATPAQAATT